MPSLLDALAPRSVPAVVSNGSTTVKDLRVLKSSQAVPERLESGGAVSHLECAVTPDDMLPTIAGLQYVPEYLDRETHDRLLGSVLLQPWQTSNAHGVQVYGYHYNHERRAAYRIGELPSWARDLAVRHWRDGFLPSVPNQLVANDYRPGEGIFAHVDQAVFGDTIASVSLGSTCVMRFSNGEGERREELLLEPRSVLVLSGEARWAWKHEIPARAVDRWQNQERLRSRRVSLTFRAIPRPSEEDEHPDPLIHDGDQS
jgi:alkylated DNA repair dioxygenase AlkB